MRLDPSPKHTQAMTLLEVVAVVFIVVILAGLLVPSRTGHGSARKAQAKTEIQIIVAAISRYEKTYSKLPGQTDRPLTNQPSDFTYGTWGTSAAANGITNGTGRQANNSEIMAALLDLTNFPNGKLTLNADHSQNPQRLPFLNLKLVNDTKSPGLGLDGVFRDRWGNPYIITLDYNSDNHCLDAFYRLARARKMVRLNRASMDSFDPPLLLTPLLQSGTPSKPLAG
jgi:type II secretory pathway pseudopilin PulG